MADPSLPTKVMMYTEEPTLSISSGSSSFLIRANPTLDSDVESTLSLNNSYNGGGDSDFELQGSDTGENEFQSPASIDNEQNPKETNNIVVFDGNKGIDYSGSVAKDSDFEESLRSDYSSTQEEEDDEDEEEGDNTESDDFVEKANEVIPIRARLTRESDDDDDVSLESGEIDNDYGFLSAVRMPVRVSSTTGIDFEDDEEEDTEFEFEIPPAAMEDVPEKEVKVLSSSEESISNADAISFLEEIKSYTEVEEEEDVLSAVEEPNIEETLISEIPPENPLIASIIQEPSFEENVSVKTHFLNPIGFEDPHDSEKYDEGNNGTVNNEEEEVSDNEEKKAEEDLSTLEEPIVVSSIETLNIEETLIPEIPPSSLENPFIASTIQEPNFEDCLNPVASEDPHDSEKYDEDNDDTVDDEDQEEEMFDLSSDSKPNDDEKKKLVKFFRFVHRLGLSSEDSLIEELLFHQMKNPNLESAKEEAKHLEEQQCQTDFDSSLNILVIGKTGVGKSATINSIFGQERAKVDAFQPETKSVTAISGTINTVKLTIFDTPGLRPSPSEHSYNTKILSSIRRAIRNTPPDIILYVDRFQEQTRDQDYLALLTSISRSLGLPIWNSTMVVFTHAGSTPFYGPKMVDDHRRVILVENDNNNGFDIERWRQRLLLMGYSMKLLLLSETEHLFKPDMEFENRFMRLLEKNYTIGEDEALMISSLFVMKMKMEVEAKSKSGKVLFRIKSTDQLQIALLSMLPIANAVFRKIFS